MTLPVLSATSALRLPAGRQFAVTWGIPDAYGGMTSALLRRSRGFATLAGAPVDVVTFDPRPECARIRAELQERGELVPGVRLRNLLEDLRDDAGPSRPVTVDPSRATRAPDEELRGSDGTLRRWRRGDAVIRTEHLRPDGSAALVDERRDGPERQRVLTSFDRAGMPAAQWHTASDLSFDWLDHLRAGDPAIVVVDSKASARLLQRYRRPGVTTVYMVHGSHLAGQDPSRLDETRRDVFESLHRWDAVVVQTERQRRDIVQLVGDTGNLAVASNAVSIPDVIPRLPRDRLHGVIVSRLSALKRVEHALRIIARVRESGLPVTAEIVGDGRQRASLEREALRLGLAGAVRFAGHVPDGPARFAGGAWTLLTSRSEAASLTLVEAMARGCLPIAYDIRYGPADVIAHRRNGWLVPDGDVEAGARALIAACVMDDAELAEMRRLAHRTALTHDDGATVAAWARVQADAVEHRSRADADQHALERIRVRHLRERYLVTAVVASPVPADARVELRVTPTGAAGATYLLDAIGRLRWIRLTRTQSDLLGNGPVRTRFAVFAGDRVATVDAGLRHPDRRGLTRRVVALVARVVSRAGGRAPRGSTPRRR